MEDVGRPVGVTTSRGSGAGSKSTSAPRLCHLVRWPHFDGYGFNLHADKKSSGQFIGKVDAGSPAETAGLREGDRIVEVNGVNICNENHRQVVERIRKVPEETRLLVVDVVADAFYKEANVVLSGDHPDVVFLTSDLGLQLPQGLESEEVQAAVPEGDGSAVDNSGRHHDHSGSSKHDGGAEDSVDEDEDMDHRLTNESRAAGVHSGQDSDGRASMGSSSASEEAVGSAASSLPRVAAAAPPSPISSSQKAELNLNMSAKEMRQKVAQNKKKDPRKEPLDFQKRYEIIQAM